MSATHNNGYLKKIAKKILDGKASDEEKLFLKEYYDAFEKQSDISERLTAEEKDILKSEIKTSLLKDIVYKQESVVPLHKRKLFVIPVAAAILLFITAGLFFYNAEQPQQQIAKKKSNDDPIIPGGNKAVLILADGSKIILDNAGNGVVAKQAGLIIRKTKDGQLVYDVSSAASLEGGDVVYNTIQTPKGGQYQVNLPDGSRVWLNAASSLKFPTIFKGKERNVELTGEAYFEVAQNKDQSFRVSSNHQVVEVLGTHFNINSYSDEPAVKTTLLEGSIKISSGNSSNIIKPGEQAQIKPGSNKIAVSQVNTEGEVAWKSGLFLFKDSDIPAVMRQLARWYDVEVNYEGTIPDRVFSGKIYKNVNLSQVLDILRFTNIRFRIEGRRIIVTP